jgi:hypothetical protein
MTRRNYIFSPWMTASLLAAGAQNPPAQASFARAHFGQTFHVCLLAMPATGTGGGLVSVRLFALDERLRGSPLSAPITLELSNDDPDAYKALRRAYAHQLRELKAKGYFARYERIKEARALLDTLGKQELTDEGSRRI